MNATQRMSDSEVITAFVAFLNAHQNIKLAVERWPDKEKDGEIDAVAGELAIEHTSLDSFERQRAESAWHLEIFRSLEQELTKPDFMLWIILPPGCLKAGEDWSVLRNGFKRWLEGYEPVQMQDGVHRVQVKDVPFEVSIQKHRGGMKGIFFATRAPGEAGFADRVKAQCGRKLKKLGRWRKVIDGKQMRPLLLLETDDVQTMSHLKVAEVLRGVYPQRPEEIDFLWYVDTSDQPRLAFLDLSNLWALPLKIPSRWTANVMPAPTGTSTAQ